MAIYESSTASTSLLFKVMDILLGGGFRRFGSTRSDPYARMMLSRNDKSNPSSLKSVSLWICFAALAVVYSKRSTTLAIWKSILKHEASSPKKQRNQNTLQTATDALQSLCRAFVRYALENLKRKDEPHDLTPTQHRGSCHCGAIRFVVFCKKTLFVEEDRSRIISYRHARIPTTALTWEEGQVRTYDSAHFFCPNCGVHLAHLTTGEEIELFINVDCLDGASYVLRPADSRPAGEIIIKDECSPHIPLTVPMETPKEPESNTKQSYPCSPSVSALDDEVAELSTDGRITLPQACSASVASVQTTEELAATAYRLRKVLSSTETPKSEGSPTVPELTSSEESVVPDADTLRRYLTKHVA